MFTRAEASRFVPRGEGDPQNDVVLAWELLYRLEPGLYDRLASAERLHPGVVGWLPRHAGQIAEVGAGTGRLTMELIERGERIVAVEPALPLRRLLRRKFAAVDHGDRVRVIAGFFDQLPLPDDFADLAVACSAFTLAGAWRRRRPRRDGAGVPSRVGGGHHLAEPPRLARRPRLPVRQLPRADVGGVSPASPKRWSWPGSSTPPRPVRSGGAARGGFPSRCWASIRRATWPSRCSPDEDRDHGAAGDGHPGAPARRFAGVRVRSGPRPGRPRPRRARVRRLRIGDPGGRGDRHRNRPPVPGGHVLPGVRAIRGRTRGMPGRRQRRPSPLSPPPTRPCRRAGTT